MSDSAVTTAPRRQSSTAEGFHPLRSFVVVFKAALESLVRSQRDRFADTEPMLYKFPPL